MTSGKGTYWANHLLNQLFNAAAALAPATIYIALYSVAPTAGGGGTEATSGSYARVAVTANTTNFPSASGGVISNGTAITFPLATADWSGAVNQVATTVMDASTSGNEFYFGSLTTPKPVLSGDTAQFAIGALSVTET